MGRIDNPLFHDRIELDRDVVRELARDYVDLIYRGNTVYAAGKLGLKERTFYAYLNGEKKSLPSETFYSIVNSLGLKPEEFDFERMSLTELQKKSVKNWREKNPERVIEIARRAAPLGIKMLEEKTGKSRKEIMGDVREGLFKKFGENPYKIIGEIEKEKLKKKYGKDWNKKMMEPAFEGLKKKYGKDWGKQIGSKANKKVREKYGQNFQIDYCSIVYGNNWIDVIHAFQWQKKNFQNLDRGDLGPLFVAISETGGYEGIKVIGALLQNKRLSTKEISEKTGYAIKNTRRILFNLVHSGMVGYETAKTTEPEDEMFSVNETQLKQRLVYLREETKNRLISYINKNKELNIGCDCGFRTTFNDAFERRFHCPSCNSILDIKEPPKILELIEKKIH